MGRKKLPWFCLHKQGVKKLDRLGRGSSTDYISILEEELMRYVLFDIEDDIRLVFGRFILCQGGKGVLIGGFLSAQLAEIWCSWREATWGFGQSKYSVEPTIKSDLAVSFPTAKMPLTLTGRTDSQNVHGPCLRECFQDPVLSPT